MSNEKTVTEALHYAADELRAANIRNARVDVSEATTTVYLQVRRSFAVEGSINIGFRLSVKDKKTTLTPEVTVNFPACNKGIAEAAAFQAVVNELTPLAASLQAQLSELKIVGEEK